MNQITEPHPLSLIQPDSRQSLTQHTDNMMGANNDSDALTLFLNKAGARSSETRRRYERDTLRFTAYIYKELGISYQQVRLKHLQLYLHFIQNLPDNWLAPGILPGQPERVLFKSAISEGKSTDQVIDVLSTFFTFLERNRYTQGNPAASLVRSGEKQAKGTSVIRYFHETEWTFVKQCLNAMPTDTPKQVNEAARTRYMLTLAYSLALRESEMTQHTCKDIHFDNEGSPYLSVLGKGRKRRHLPLNDEVIQRIQEYQALHGVQQSFNNTFPLAPRTRKSQGELKNLSARGLRFWWQGFMNDCAKQTEDALLQTRLKEMPFHSLRHTALTHLARKMDIEDLAIFAGHDSINTTSQYYHTEAKRLRTLTAEHSL